MASRPTRGTFAVIGNIALSFVIVHDVNQPAFGVNRYDGAASIERVTRTLDLDAPRKDELDRIHRLAGRRDGKVSN